MFWVIYLIIINAIWSHLKSVCEWNFIPWWVCPVLSWWIASYLMNCLYAKFHLGDKIKEKRHVNISSQAEIVQWVDFYWVLTHLLNMILAGCLNIRNVKQYFVCVFVWRSIVFFVVKNCRVRTSNFAKNKVLNK